MRKSRQVYLENKLCSDIKQRTLRVKDRTKSLFELLLDCIKVKITISWLSPVHFQINFWIGPQCSTFELTLNSKYNVIDDPIPGRQELSTYRFLLNYVANGSGSAS